MTSRSLLRGALLLCVDALELTAASPPHALETHPGGWLRCAKDCPGCKFERARHAALESARLALNAVETVP